MYCKLGNFCCVLIASVRGYVGPLLMFCVFISAATHTSAALVHQWNLDDPSATTLTDLAGSCHAALYGQIQRPANGPPETVLPETVLPETGLPGGAVTPTRFLRLDGIVENYVDFGNDDSLSPDQISVAFWIRASDEPDVDYADRVILSKHGGETSASSWEFGFSNDDSPRLQFVSWGGSGKVYTRSNRFSVDDFQDGQWHHVVGTCGGSEARLYVDGALLEMSTQTGTIAKTTYPLNLGRRSFESIDPNQWAFPGDIGGPLLIYDQALSPADITAMVSYSPPSPNPSLQGRWDLDQIDTTTTPKVLGPADGQLAGNMILAAGGPPPISLPDGTQVVTDKHFVCGGQAGDNINLGNDAALNPREITVAVWAKASGDHTDQVLLAKRDDSQASFELTFDSFFDELCFTVYTGSSHASAGSTLEEPCDSFGISDFNDGQWHHFVGTHDGTYTSLYIDGVRINSMLNRGFVNDTGGSVDLLIGNNSASEGDPFDGLIGGPLLLFNYAFSPQAVTAMFENAGPWPMPGDANEDGRIDSADAAVLAANWLTSGSEVTWKMGDFSGDGRVDEADATILAANWHATTAPPASVPEPSAIMLLAALTTVLTMLVRLRR